jgi:hypothetical protein
MTEELDGSPKAEPGVGVSIDGPDAKVKRMEMESRCQGGMQGTWAQMPEDRHECTCKIAPCSVRKAARQTTPQWTLQMFV